MMSLTTQDHIHCSTVSVLHKAVPEPAEVEIPEVGQ